MKSNYEDEAKALFSTYVDVDVIAFRGRSWDKLEEVEREAWFQVAEEASRCDWT